MPQKSIEDVLAANTKDLMEIEGVVGVGQGKCNDQPCIRVFVAEITPEIEEKIPDQLEGYPVDIEETGGFRAFPQNKLK